MAAVEAAAAAVVAAAVAAVLAVVDDMLEATVADCKGLAVLDSGALVALDDRIQPKKVGWKEREYPAVVGESWFDSAGMAPQAGDDFDSFEVVGRTAVAVVAAVGQHTNQRVHC